MSPGRITVRGIIKGGLPGCIPVTVVKDNKQNRKPIRPGDMMDGNRYTEDVCAVANAADDLMIRFGKFSAQRRTRSPAQRPGG